MTRRQWVGLAGVLFGAAMLAGILVAGTTPDTGRGAVERYTEYWSESGNQDRAGISSIILTFAVVLLVAFAAGLRWLLRRGDDGPLPGLVLGAGAASAALFGAGSALVNGAGIAAGESTGYEVDGNDALLLEGVGYYVLATAVMCAAAMALAAAISNRSAGVLPGWTLFLSGLLALVALGSIFTAWINFMLLPLWAIVVGGVLLATKDADVGAAHAS